MYIELYNQNLEHISNVDMVTFDLTKRVYGTDTFSAKGLYQEDISRAKVLRLCQDNGYAEYSCFVESLEFDGNEVKIIGLDFRYLLKTEALLDFTTTFDSSLYAILKKAFDVLFSGNDLAYNAIPVNYNIPNEFKNINTKETVADYTGTYIINDISSFIETYLRIYEYYIQIDLNLSSDIRGLSIRICEGEATYSISLEDFEYKRSTTSIATNKTVATIKFDSKIENEDGTTTIKPRPSTLATVYYYLTKDNQIIQSKSPNLELESRIYPVVAKYYEDEYLAKSQFNAAYELACNRYVDNILIDVNSKLDPIDLESISLCTLFNVYHNGIFIYTIPLAEKTIKLSVSGRTCQIKLGYKKMLLTEIIKR